MSLSTMSSALCAARLGGKLLAASRPSAAHAVAAVTALRAHVRGFASRGSQFGAKEDPFHDLPLPTPAQLREAAGTLPDKPVPAPLSPEMRKILLQEVELGRDSAFMLVDLDSVVRKCEEWKRQLPRVRPFYATDANPDKLVVSTLAGMGVGLECISRGELDIAAWASVKPESILFAATPFTRSHLKRAGEMGVRLFSCDNADDMLHVARAVPGASVILRVHAREGADPVPMGRKAGASVVDVPFLATAASNLKLKVAGVGFHVGFASNTLQTYEAGVKAARHAWDMLKKAGHHPTIVNIGGGFPAVDPLTRTPFSSIGPMLSAALDGAFPEPDVQFIAEPGRFLVAESHTMVASVVGKRRIGKPLASLPAARCLADCSGLQGPGFMYYLSDGIYGGFNSLMFDPSTVEVSTDAARICGAAKGSKCMLPLAPQTLPLDFAIQLESSPRPRVLTQCSSNGAGEKLCLDTHGVPYLTSASNLNVLHADLVRLATDTQGINRGTTLALEYHQGLPPSYGATVVAAAPEETPAVPLVVGVLPTGADPASRPHSSDTEVRKVTGDLRLSTLWGPTTQNVTATMAETWLPELNCGDTVYFQNLGAYTSPRWSHVNSVHPPARVYVRNGALLTRSTHPEFAEYE